jgi:hypothetical protein
MSGTGYVSNIEQHRRTARDGKLAEIERQVAAGELVIRQATDEERASWPPRAQRLPVRRTRDSARFGDVAAWVDECCELTPGVWTPAALLRSAYAGWCSAQGLEPNEARAAWGRALGELGCERHQRSGVRGWMGLRLRDAGRGDE